MAEGRSGMVRRLEATARTVHCGFFDAALAPVLEVQSGEEIWVETVSADPAHEVPPEWLPRDMRDIFEIRLTQPYGYNMVSPMKGMFPGEEPRLETTIIPIDLASGVAKVAPGVTIKTRPFFGQLGIPPPP